MKVMKPSMDVLNERVSCMKCGVHNVETPPYPEDEEVQGFHDILKEYEPAYDPTLRESEALKKMPRICNFIEDEWHCKKTAYLVEYKLCGREGCPLCPRDLRVRDIEDDELTKEVTIFCPLPCLNAESDGFLSFDESQANLDKGDTVADEMKYYHKMRKKNEGDSTQLDIARKNDGKLTKLTNWSKV